MSPIQAYILLFFGVIVGGWVFFQFRELKDRFLRPATTFGGAFIFAICFLKLLPHAFEMNEYDLSVEGHHTAEIVGVFILLGFIIQLLLERLSKGVDHGHTHGDIEKNVRFSTLLIGLSLHSFLEGIPIVNTQGNVNVGLVMGIVIHNIPITMILTALLLDSAYSKKMRYLYLACFASMSLIGSIVGRLLMDHLGNFENYIMGFVVGILLHVSVSILFIHEERGSKVPKLLIIILAFVLAYTMPACSH